MKTKHLIPILFLAAFCTVSAQTNTAPDKTGQTSIPAFGQKVNVYTNKITYDTIIASIRAGNSDDFDPLALNVIKERDQYIYVLLNMFRDTRASDYQKCAVAYFLGEVHAETAVNDLVSNITLHVNTSAFSPWHVIAHWPSVTGALVKIGTPAIPALIKNLQESDDAKVVDFSLKVLYQIEGDKDVVQLRLQKALDAQQDATKKTRLQAAIKSLPEIKIPSNTIIPPDPIK